MSMYRWLGEVDQFGLVGAACFTEPSAGAPDAKINIRVIGESIIIPGLNSRIRRHRARFCN